LQVRFPCYLFNDVTREVTDRQAHNMCSSHVVVDNVRMGRGYHSELRLFQR
jgi:hypothetical protein